MFQAIQIADTERKAHECAENKRKLQERIKSLEIAVEKAQANSILHKEKLECVKNKEKKIVLEMKHQLSEYVV